MESMLLGMLAETSIHPGSGRSVGVVDLPVAREAATDYPFIPGSGLKGALKDKARVQELAELDRLFGKNDNAGAFLISDARLLLLPVRSLTGSSCWVCCPLQLERYCRDRRRAGLPAFDIPTVQAGQALNCRGDSTLFLEEREFNVSGAIPQDALQAISELLYHSSTQSRLETQLVILNDDDLSWFARYALSVQARNVLNEKTKESRNLWYEESLPPDTVMVSLLAGRQAGACGQLTSLFSKNPYLQAGGNETVGQGWFAIKQLQAGSKEEG